MCLYKSIKQLTTFQNIVSNHSIAPISQLIPKEESLSKPLPIGSPWKGYHTLPQLGTPNVLVGFLAAWLLAASPTKRSAWDYPWMVLYHLWGRNLIVYPGYVCSSLSESYKGGCGSFALGILDDLHPIILELTGWYSCWLTLGKGMPKKRLGIQKSNPSQLENPS